MFFISIFFFAPIGVTAKTNASTGGLTILTNTGRTAGADFAWIAVGLRFMLNVCEHPAAPARSVAAMKSMKQRLAIISTSCIE